VLFAGWDLGHDIGNPNATDDVARIRALPLPVWAIATDIDVQVVTGGD